MKSSFSFVWSIPLKRFDPRSTPHAGFGTDASFYRLIKLVVRVQSETDVVFLMRACLELDFLSTLCAPAWNKPCFGCSG